MDSVARAQAGPAGPHGSFNITIAAITLLALTYISGTHVGLSMCQTLAFTLYLILTTPSSGCIHCSGPTQADTDFQKEMWPARGLGQPVPVGWGANPRV